MFIPTATTKTTTNSSWAATINFVFLWAAGLFLLGHVEASIDTSLKYRIKYVEVKIGEKGTDDDVKLKWAISGPFIPVPLSSLVSDPFVQAVPPDARLRLLRDPCPGQRVDQRLVHRGHGKVGPRLAGRVQRHGVPRETKKWRENFDRSDDQVVVFASFSFPGRFSNRGDRDQVRRLCPGHLQHHHRGRPQRLGGRQW